MANWCPRCRGIEGAHFAWCIQASMWERDNGALPTPELVEMPDLPPVEQSVTTEVSGDLVAELRAELTASRETVATLREQRDRLAAELDDFRVKLEEARKPGVKLPIDPAKAAEIAKLIETEGDALGSLMRQRDDALRGRTDACTQRDLAKAELRTARQQLDTAIRERDKARKLISDPTALREQRRREAEEIRELARQAQDAQGERVVDHDAGQEDVARPTNVMAKMVIAEKAEENLADAVAEVEAAGAIVEVVEPEAAPVEYAAVVVEPAPTPAAMPSRAPKTEAEERSQEAADLLAAAELYVSEAVVRTPGRRLKNPDLLAGFEAWLASDAVEFTRKWSTTQLSQRQLGIAMKNAGFRKRQVFDPETQSAPQNYLDAALAAAPAARPRESADDKEGNHRGGLTPEVDHSAGLARMREAAQEAKRPAGNVALGNTGLPGREIKNTDLRKMVMTLVQEQGWRYERPTGRGHPRLIAPDGRTKKLATTPSGQSAIVKARSDLRRMGAVL